MDEQSYVAIVPVKSPAIGKSRLRVPGHVRPELARAFALDTLAAVRATPTVAHVAVVTADHGFAATCAGSGYQVLPDGRDLNDGLRRAAAILGPAWPEATPLALCADLPCLTSAHLAEALEQMDTAGAWFVADAGGEGTTLYAAPYAGFDPHFGLASRRAHEAAGARAVPGDLSTLRRDVDDEADLAEAIRLGTGVHTRDVLAVRA